MINSTVRPLVVLLALATLAGCSTSVRGAGTTGRPLAGSRAQGTTATASALSPTPSRVHRTVAKAAPATRPVHAGLFEGADEIYGVGMPVIIRFTHRITDRAAFARTVHVSVNGAAAAGAWQWERSPAPGWSDEAHYRTAAFWPAHSTVSIDAPLKGTSAGRGLAFDDNLTLSMRIGAAHISTVDASDTDPHLTVTSDGRTVRTIPASLGAADTPTYRGTKLVEEFDREQNMGGTEVPWSVRLTNSGEFVHAAPWNSDIGRANLSHGCTNLSTADAEWFFHFSHLGDVVQYPNAPGPRMTATDGLGDWNVPWTQWRAGGSL